MFCMWLFLHCTHAHLTRVCHVVDWIESVHCSLNRWSATTLISYCWHSIIRWIGWQSRHTEYDSILLYYWLCLRETFPWSLWSLQVLHACNHHCCHDYNLQHIFVYRLAINEPKWTATKNAYFMHKTATCQTGVGCNIYTTNQPYTTL